MSHLEQHLYNDDISIIKEKNSQTEVKNEDPTPVLCFFSE